MYNSIIMMNYIHSKSNLRAENILIVAIAFSENGMPTGQGSLPFEIAGVAIFVAFLAAFVLHFATLFQSSALLLALVVFVIGISFNVTIHGASMSTIETSVTRLSTMRFSRFQSATDNSPMAASGKIAFFLDFAFDF